MQKGSEVFIAKAESRININIALLSIGFLLFTLIVTIAPTILSKNILLAAELTLTIPLLIASCLARTKTIDIIKKEVWNNFGFITFILGYGLLISVIGMFLSSIVNIQISMLFFGVNIIMALIYSIIEVIENKTKISSRVYKDALFILVLIFCGILPSLGFY